MNIKLKIKNIYLLKIQWNMEELLLHQNLDIWWEKNNDIKIKTTWSCL